MKRKRKKNNNYTVKTKCSIKISVALHLIKHIDEGVHSYVSKALWESYYRVSQSQGVAWLLKIHLHSICLHVGNSNRYEFTDRCIMNLFFLSLAKAKQNKSSWLLLWINNPSMIPSFIHNSYDQIDGYHKHLKNRQRKNYSHKSFSMKKKTMNNVSERVNEHFKFVWTH